MDWLTAEEVQMGGREGGKEGGREELTVRNAAVLRTWSKEHHRLAYS